MPSVFQAKVTKGGVTTNLALFPSVAEANAWITKCQGDGSFPVGAAVAVTDITQAFYAAKVREQRNALLTACDWTTGNDSKYSVPQRLLWQTYRQALRDLPQKTTDFTKVVWPTPPA